jgi:hypothetical protein
MMNKDKLEKETVTTVIGENKERVRNENTKEIVLHWNSAGVFQKY